MSDIEVHLPAHPNRVTPPLVTHLIRCAAVGATLTHLLAATAAAPPRPSPPSPNPQQASPLTGERPGAPTQPRPLTFTAPVEPRVAGELLTLEQLIELARTQSPALSAVRAQALSVQAGVQSAAAYPNPQIEAIAGAVRSRGNLGASFSGAGTDFGVAQPIENPWLRRARIAVAQASATGAQASVAVAEAAVLAELRQRYFEVLRTQEELQAARDDAVLAEQIRDRVRVRVRVGESPRFDLVRADTEVSIARRNVTTAQSRVAQAKALLRLAVAPGMPGAFEVDGEPERVVDAEAIDALRAAMLESSPALRAAEAEVQRAQQQIGVERGLVWPNAGVRVLQSSAPDVRSLQAGVFINVPVFDQRIGPIRAAQQQFERSRFEVEQRRFELAQSFDAARQAYLASAEQLRALEGGIISGARTSLEIAEAAYRLGERGILEFLDAQRTFRAVRNELIAARYNLQAARIELERLAGLPL